MYRDNPGTPLQPTLPAQAKLPAQMRDQLVPQADARCTHGLWILPPWGTFQLAANKQVPISLTFCPLFLYSQHIILQENSQPNKHPVCKHPVDKLSCETGGKDVIRTQTLTLSFQTPHILQRVFKDQPSHHWGQGFSPILLDSTAQHHLGASAAAHPSLSTKTQDLNLEESVLRTAKKNKASKGHGRFSDVLTPMVMDIQKCPEETSFQ